MLSAQTPKQIKLDFMAEVGEVGEKVEGGVVKKRYHTMKFDKQKWTDTLLQVTCGRKEDLELYAYREAAFRGKDLDVAKQQRVIVDELLRRRVIDDYKRNPDVEQILEKVAQSYHQHFNFDASQIDKQTVLRTPVEITDVLGPESRAHERVYVVNAYPSEYSNPFNYPISACLSREAATEEEGEPNVPIGHYSASHANESECIHGEHCTACSTSAPIHKIFKLSPHHHGEVTQHMIQHAYEVDHTRRIIHELLTSPKIASKLFDLPSHQEIRELIAADAIVYDDPKLPFEVNVKPNNKLFDVLDNKTVQKWLVQDNDVGLVKMTPKKNGPKYWYRLSFFALLLMYCELANHPTFVYAVDKYHRMNIKFWRSDTTNHRFVAKDSEQLDGTVVFVYLSATALEHFVSSATNVNDVTKQLREKIGIVEEEEHPTGSLDDEETQEIQFEEED